MLSFKTIKTFSLTLLVCLALASCGFRLQGTERFPESLATTYIDTPDQYSLFYQELRAELINGGIQLVDTPVNANAVIRVQQDDSGQRVLTVSARNVPTEYDVFYRIRYSVWINGEEVLPPRTLNVNQDYTYDVNTVLGKNREQQAISDVLAKNLVRQVAQQLSLL